MTTYRNDSAMTTFTITCPCGCGSLLTAHDAGFSATVVTMDACPTRAAAGVVSFSVRKSDAYAAAVPASSLRQVDGLVSFG